MVNNNALTTRQYIYISLCLFSIYGRHCHLTVILSLLSTIILRVGDCYDVSTVLYASNVLLLATGCHAGSSILVQVLWA